MLHSKPLLNRKFFTAIATAVVILSMTVSHSATAGHGNHRMKDRMKAMDTNGDGNISADEHEAWGQQKFKKIDTNQDQLISEEERKTYQRERHKQRLEKRLQKLQEAE